MLTETSGLNSITAVAYKPGFHYQHKGVHTNTKKRMHKEQQHFDPCIHRFHFILFV